jgi:hypothetical protein
MKVDKTTLEQWRMAIAPLDTPELRVRYIARDIPRHRPNMDINIRYAHDLLWAAVDRGLITYEELEPYYDSHIATALRNIVPKLEVVA